MALTRPTLNVPMMRLPRPRPCSQVGRDGSTMPKRQSRIDFFLSRPHKAARRAGTVGTEGDRRDARVSECWKARSRWRRTTRARRHGQRFKSDMLRGKNGDGQARRAWRSLSGRRLTKSSSAASVASPLQRGVRPSPACLVLAYREPDGWD